MDEEDRILYLGSSLTHEATGDDADMIDGIVRVDPLSSTDQKPQV